jgi:hypothetical protein
MLQILRVGRQQFPGRPYAKKHVLDARFEVIGAPYSLLSASLSASQTLYTRRGTLVGVSGKAENVSDTWSSFRGRNSLLIHWVGPIDIIYSRAFSTSPSGHSFPVSENIFNEPDKSFNIYEIPNHLYGSFTS